MINPRLYQRSLASAAQWRLLLLFWLGLSVPAAIVALPVAKFLSRLLDHSTASVSNVAWMDGPTLIELARQLSTDGNSELIGQGLLGGLLAMALVAPLLAGAAVAAARADEPLRFPHLVGGAGEFYFRMLRTTLVGLIPLGIGAGIAAAISWGASQANQKEIWETVASRRQLFAIAGSAAVLFVCHLLVDLTRAQFGADPTRTSAFFAFGASLRIFFRRPFRVLGVGLVGSLAAFVPASALMLLRARLTQSSLPLIALAWLLAQIAQVAIGWGRNARIFGFAELVRADALDRPRVPAFNMEPPVSSPPAPALEASPLASVPEAASADLSTPDRSVT